MARPINVKRISVLGVAAVCAAWAQAPRLGDIEFYGLRRLSAAKLKQTLNIKEGDPLPPSKGDLEERLEAVPGVVQVRVEAVCCQEGKAILFVGIEEKGAPHFAFRSAPSGSAEFPQEIVDTYMKFLQAVESAGRRGKIAEDLTKGHGLMADPEPREVQQKFLEIAKERLPLLREVLRACAEPEQRAIAAALIGYAPDKKAVLDDLQYAMQDPDEGVRANAMRSLTAFAVLAAREPGLGMRIPATWFVEMLNSIVLSDRIRAATALVTLTEKDAAAVLQQVRERALDSVVEMARWKALDYALPPFILVARLAGLNQEQTEEAWTHGEREKVIAKALGSRARK
ncbi:MAG: HEAT repeat domain-containing protein [Bryobacteraceae bacterium]